MAGLTERNEGNIPIHVDSKPSGIDIIAENRLISDKFSQFYVKRGYQYVKPEGILPKDDNTVIFTGATITPLKRFLQEGVPQPGLVMVQKCLRVKRLDEMFDIDKYPDWTHYFTMCGTLSAPGRIEDLSGEAYDFLTDELKINPKNLQIEASSKDRDLSAHWVEKGVKVEEDAHPDEYYRWQYGIPGVYGRGLNIVLRHDANDTYRDLGNVVSVENSDDKTIAFEFGFGLESLLSKMHGFKKPMEASTVCSIVPYEEGVKEKLLNALVAAIVIYHHDVQPGKGRERHVLKKLVKGVSFLRRKMGISIEEIENVGNLFENAEFEIGKSSGSKLIEDITQYEEQLIKFTDYARNQTHAHRLRNKVDENLDQKIRRMGNNMGILLTDIEDIVNPALTQ